MRYPCPLGRATSSLLLLALAGWIQASAGIIELGRKGQTSTGSSYKVVIEGVLYSDPNHAMGDTSQTILGRIKNNINNDVNGRFSASDFNDPGDPNGNDLTIVRRAGGEPSTVEVSIDDGNIKGAFIQFGPSGGFHAKLKGVDAVNQDGSLEVDITVHGGGVISHVITTAGKSRDAVNAELVADFTADGFVFDGPPNGPWNISKFGICLGKIEMKATDTGVRVSGVELDSYVPPTIPTLSEWGLASLLALLALGGAFLLRSARTKGAPSDAA